MNKTKLQVNNEKLRTILRNIQNIPSGGGTPKIVSGSVDAKNVKIVNIPHGLGHKPSYYGINYCWVSCDNTSRGGDGKITITADDTYITAKVDISSMLGSAKFTDKIKYIAIE